MSILEKHLEFALSTPLFQEQHSKIRSSTRWKSLNTVWKLFNSKVSHSIQLNGYGQLIYFEIFVFVKLSWEHAPLRKICFCLCYIISDRICHLIGRCYYLRLLHWSGTCLATYQSSGAPHVIEADRKISLNMREKNPFLTVRVVKPCHRLPIEVVETLFFKIFITWEAMALRNLL